MSRAGISPVTNLKSNKKMKNTRFKLVEFSKSKHSLKRALILGALALATAQQLSAIMLVDRGLPTKNLNDAAGDDRSNINWWSATGVSLVGDSFANTSSHMWYINSIRLWTDGELDTPPKPILWGGVDAGPIGVVAPSGELTATSYENEKEKQYEVDGFLFQLFQIDFDVNISLAPGQTYRFFIDGTDPSYSGYIFSEASNAKLSGSPQDGADDLMLKLSIVNGVAGSPETWTSLNNGWDKASDLNVQVFGSVPDGGTTLVLLGGALTGLGALRWKFRG